MKKQEAEDLIDIVIDHAPKLRAAGVLELGIIGLKLAPLDPEADDEDETETAEVRAAREEEQLSENPWYDPKTFGRSTGVPGNDPRKKKG